MTVRDLLNILPKFTLVDIVTFAMPPTTVHGYAFELIKESSSILLETVLHMDPNDGRTVRILIKARHKDI